MLGHKARIHVSHLALKGQWITSPMGSPPPMGSPQGTWRPRRAVGFPGDGGLIKGASNIVMAARSFKPPTCWGQKDLDGLVPSVNCL